jgi:hypothetical protein
MLWIQYDNDGKSIGATVTIDRSRDDEFSQKLGWRS